MRSVNLHLKVLIFLLVALGLGSIAYERYVLQIPFTDREVENLWTIDAKITYDVPRESAVTTKFYIPASYHQYTKFSESLITDKQYGQVLEEDEVGNKIAHYSIRRTKGPETIYYRLALSPNFGGTEKPLETIGTIYREPIALEGAAKVAADALVSDIRATSSNTLSFISEAIRRVNDLDNPNVDLLLKGDSSAKNRYNVAELLLSQAHIPVQRVNTLELKPSVDQPTEIWLRSYIETAGRDKETNRNVTTGKWYYFNMSNGSVGLPKNAIIWWVGDDPLVSVNNGVKPKVSFSVTDKELTAISLAQANNAESSDFLAYSLYSLPISIQYGYELMLMIPFGVLVILLVRNVVGIQTLGTFTPVLIALAFRETGLAFGIAFFTIITSVGLLVRSYLEHLKLQMLSRLSVVLTFVIIMIAVLSIFSYKMGFAQGLAIGLFPMVILTMTIERLSITWEERGAGNVLKISIGTLIASSLAYLLMEIPEFVYFVFTFPGVLLVLAGFMLMMGRYRGYRLTELKRFKAMLKEEK